MAKSPLILAALAIDAVPGVNFTDVKPLTTGSNGAFDTAILTTAEGQHFVIRIAENQAAETEQTVELHALKALDAIRDQLPFKITRLVGETKDARGQRALVFDYVYGNPIDVTRVAPGGHLAEKIGKALAAIHNVPTSVVDDAGLPSFDPAALIRARVAEVDRAAATGKVPPVLLSRWENALEDAELFRYLPTVIHGALNGETVLENDDDVSGVLAWSTLRVSDPAEDFAWIFGAGLTELADAVLFSYSIDRQLSDPSIRKRAALYSELDMARWLLHGVSKNDAEIIEDAESMLKQLAEDLNEGNVLPLSSAAVVAVAHEDSFISAVVSDVTEEITIVATQEPAEPEESQEPQESQESQEPVDSKTRVIELPEKSDNELF
jgi:aminoglycoside phosphotransferase (APT) family kinase protein